MSPRKASTQKTSQAMEATENPNEQTTALVPNVVEQLKSQTTGDLSPLPRGHVELMALDANGDEVAGSEFTIHEKGYKKYFSDETKFRLKKKAQ